MAITVDPTVTQIVTEGLKKGGRVNPTLGDISEAATIHFQEVKSDIYLKSPRNKALLSQIGIGTVVGQTRYTQPVYIEDIRSIQLINAPVDGSYRATAQAGGASTITLALAFTQSDSTNIIGRMVFITGGTGAGQFAQIIGWNNTTKVATIEATWVSLSKSAANAWVVPDNTSQYLVENIRYKLWDIDKPYDFDTNSTPFQQGTPSRACLVGNQIWLNMTPDLVYVLLVDYWFALDQLDEVDTLFTAHLRRFRSLWVQGVASKISQRFDDRRAPQIASVYNYMLDLYGTTSSSVGQVRFVDY